MGTYTPDAIAARSLELHEFIARKLQADPGLLELVRANLDGREAPAHSAAYRQAWREAVEGGLASTLAVALDPSEYGTTMRSCTPLGCVLTEEERAQFFREWWARRPPMAATPAFLDRIDEDAPLPPHFTLPRRRYAAVVATTAKQQIKARFPYQLADPHLGVSIAYGWAQIVIRLCEDVDAALGDDRRNFHWTQVKEKAGSCRFHWMAVGKHSSLDQEGEDAVLARIRELVRAAEELTCRTCAVCGAPGELDVRQPWVLTLCPEHSAAHAQGKLPAVFEPS